MSRHSLRLIYYFANEYFVFACQFVSLGIAEIESQPVGFQKMPARSGIVKLRNVLDLKSLPQDNRLEGPSQVYQME
jgi:hypothetical protein